MGADQSRDKKTLSSRDSKDEKSEDSSGDKRDPMTSTLTRRKQRKSGIIAGRTRAESYALLRGAPSTLAPHLLQCLDWHTTKPWLDHRVRVNLVAYPRRSTNPPNDIRQFFSATPYRGVDDAERTLLANDGDGYIWYIPSPLLNNAHCYVQHRSDDQMKCDVQEHTREFTDSDGNSQSFVFAVIFDNNTLKILDAESYRKECAWWAANSGTGGGFLGIKSGLKSKGIDTREGEQARALIRQRIARAFTDLGRSLSESDPIVQQIEANFVYAVKQEGKNTIFTFVERCLAVLIFISSQSPIFKYTSVFRSRLVGGYYNFPIIPYLTTFDMFPDFYNLSGSVKNQEMVERWVHTYHTDEVDAFFNTLVGLVDPTVSRPVMIRDTASTLDINPSALKSQTEVCGAGAPDIDTVIYKDDAGKMWCFNISQLLARKDNHNPLNPSETIRAEFLARFDSMYNSSRKVALPRDQSCSNCRAYVDKNVVGKSGPHSAAVTAGFCSHKCLEEFRDVADLFDDDSVAVAAEQRDRDAAALKELQSGYESKLQSLRTASLGLSKKLSDEHRIVQTLELSQRNSSEERSRLKNIIADRDRDVLAARGQIADIETAIARAAGVENLNRANMSGIIKNLEPRDPQREQKERDVRDLQHEVQKLQRENARNMPLREERDLELTRLGDVIAGLQSDLSKTDNARQSQQRELQTVIANRTRLQSELAKSRARLVELDDVMVGANSQIAAYVDNIKQSKDALLLLQAEVTDKDREYSRALEAKNSEISSVISERDAAIAVEHARYLDLQSNSAEKSSVDMRAQQAVIAQLQSDVNNAIRTQEELKSGLQARNAELISERASIQKLLAKDENSRRQYNIILSAKDAEIASVSRQRQGLEQKLSGIPELVAKIREYETDSTRVDQVRALEAQLSLKMDDGARAHELGNKIDQLQSEIFILRQNVASCNNDSDRAADSAKIASLSATISDRENIITGLNSQISALDRQNKKCDVQGDSSSEIVKLRDQMSQREREYQQRLSDQELATRDQLALRDVKLAHELSMQQQALDRDMKVRLNQISGMSLSEDQIVSRIQDAVANSNKKITQLYDTRLQALQLQLDASVAKDRKLQSSAPVETSKLIELERKLAVEQSIIGRLQNNIDELTEQKRIATERCATQGEDKISEVYSLPIEVGDDDISRDLIPVKSGLKHVVSSKVVPSEYVGRAILSDDDDDEEVINIKNKNVADNKKMPRVDVVPAAVPAVVPVAANVSASSSASMKNSLADLINELQTFKSEVSAQLQKK